MTLVGGGREEDKGAVRVKRCAGWDDGAVGLEITHWPFLKHLT